MFIKSRMNEMFAAAGWPIKLNIKNQEMISFKGLIVL